MKILLRVSICLIMFFCFQTSIILAQGCKDRDNDGYFNKEGCGTLVDCDDSDGSMYPGALQICDDGKNNDCGHPHWPGLAGTNEFDDDGDLYSECQGDCNDADVSINPESIEICDGFDNDCNDLLDEGCEIVCNDFGKWGLDRRVTYDVADLEYFSLAWTGSEYAISWDDRRDEKWEIYFARLDSLGNKIGSDLRVTFDASPCKDPSLVWTGSEYGISWENWDSPYIYSEIYFARLDSSGNKIGSDVRVTYDDRVSESPSTIWTGSEYGIAWNDGRDGNDEIYFVRLDSSGNKIGSDARVTYESSPSFDVSLAWTGSEYGVAWEDYRTGISTSEIYFARLDSSGNKIGSDVRVTYDGAGSDYPSLLWADNEYGITWGNYQNVNTEVCFAKLDSSGNMIGTEKVISEDDGITSSSAFLAWNGTEFGLSWADHKFGNYEIHFSRLDPSGNKIGSEVRITSDMGVSVGPSLVWTGSEYGISWNENRDANREIYFARLACCDGDYDLDTYDVCQDCNDNDDSIHPAAIEVCDGIDNDCDGTVDDDCCYPGVDNDSDSYDECEDCDDSDDTIHPAAPEFCDGINNDCDSGVDEGCPGACFNANNPGSNVRVTYNGANSKGAFLVWTGTEYGVSWGDDRDGNNEIYFARLDSNANKMGSDVRVTFDEISTASPYLVWTGTEYGMSWWDQRDGNREIYFARLDSSGNKIGSDVRVTYDDAVSNSPSLAWTGTEYGVSWSDFRDDSGIYENDEIYFARLDASGNKFGDDIRVTYRMGFSARPSLVWTGSEYGVSWWESKPGVYFARLDASGNKIGSDMEISDGAVWNDDDTAPGSISLVWNGNGYGVSWNDYSESLNYPATIWLKRLDSSGNKIGSDVRITFHEASTSSPRLAWTGTEYGMCWNDAREGNNEVYFARIYSDGSKIGTDLRITNDSSSSGGPVLVWVDSKYAISFSDNRDENYEIYYAPVECCDSGIDADFDSFNECDDCDDSYSTVYPGADEICDLKDNDCDGTIDEGFPTPGYTSGLVFASDKQTMSWNIETTADRYDVVKGDLMALRNSLGDFTSSLSNCLEDDSTDMQATDTAEPSPGGGFYFLVRAQASCKDGTYDTGQAGQAGLRDAELESSSNACP